MSEHVLAALDTDNRTNTEARWTEAIREQQVEIAERDVSLVNINLVIANFPLSTQFPGSPPLLNSQINLPR